MPGDAFPDPPDIGVLGNRNEEHDANDCGWSCPLHRGEARNEEMARRAKLRSELRVQAQEIRDALARRVAAPPRSEAASEAASGPDGASLAGGYALPNPIGETAEVAAEGKIMRRVVTEHVYLSTSCVHGHHSHCSASEVPQDIRVAEGRGVVAGHRRKKPSECKHCGSRCICSCHCWRRIDADGLPFCGFHATGNEYEAEWPCPIGWTIEGAEA